MTDNNMTYYCEKCRKTMRGSEFYTSNNLEKYPNEGKMTQCKKCLTMHVDNWDPDTYLWILQEIDVPYIPDEWNKLLATYGKDRSKVGGTTIIGRYVSKMKLKQFKDYRWKDNEFLQQLANNKIEQAMKRQGYDAAQITEVIQKATFSMPTEDLAQPVYEDEPDPQENYASERELENIGDTADSNIDLTDEDRNYLRIKWGKLYKPEEWVQLEQLFQEMMASYDIQTAGDINTLKLACKSSLKANQLLDLGDIEGAQKMSRVYDNFMKSGKWTAAQNKTEEAELIDSIGELVALCETDGFIPRYYVDSPKDKVDRVIQDNQIYLRELVENEQGLGQLIENSLKAIEDEKKAIQEASVFSVGEKEQSEEDALFDYNSEDSIVEDADFQELAQLEEKWKDEDELTYSIQLRDD